MIKMQGKTEIYNKTNIYHHHQGRNRSPSSCLNLLMMVCDIPKENPPLPHTQSLPHQFKTRANKMLYHICRVNKF